MPLRLLETWKNKKHLKKYDLLSKRVSRTDKLKNLIHTLQSWVVGNWDIIAESSIIINLLLTGIVIYSMRCVVL